MPYVNGVVSVGTTATQIASPSSVPENAGVLIQNLSAATVYIGGSTVTAWHHVDGRVAGGRECHRQCADHGRRVGSDLRDRRLRYSQCRLTVPRLVPLDRPQGDAVARFLRGGGLLGGRGSHRPRRRPRRVAVRYDDSFEELKEVTVVRGWPRYRDRGSGQPSAQSKTPGCSASRADDAAGHPLH
jgi:hypothetical protein